LVWFGEAWEEYLWWQVQDRKILKRIDTLLKDIVRNGNSGIGKPEALRHQLSGYRSRHITDEHRLVYRLEGFRARCRVSISPRVGLRCVGAIRWEGGPQPAVSRVTARRPARNSATA